MLYCRIFALRFACNFLMASLICFRYWEFWSLGGLENLYNILRISESPNLPAAKANIKVILPHLHSCSKRGQRAKHLNLESPLLCFCKRCHLRQG